MSQAQRQLVTLGALVAVAAGLGAFAWFGVHQPDQKAAEKKSHDERLFSAGPQGHLAPDGGAAKVEFTSLSITAKGETTKLTREPGGPWRLTAPVQAKADALVLDGVVSQLQTARFKATLEETPDAATLAKYGLDHPSFKVEGEARVDGVTEVQTVSLEGGIENTFDGSIYLRRGGDPAVHTAQGGVRFALEKSTFELRDKKVMDFPLEKLESFQVKTPLADWTVSKRADGQWALGDGKLADAAAFTGMCGTLRAVSATAFPQGTTGFEAPLARATVTLTGGEVITFTIIRPPGDAGATWIVRRHDAQGDVDAVVDQTALAFDKQVAELRDHTVLPIKRELVTKVTFHPGEGPDLVVEKDSPDASAEAWRLVAPQQGKVQVFKLTNALWALTTLKYSKVVEATLENAAKYGLGAGARWVAFTGADGKELGRVVLGGRVPGSTEAGYLRGLEDQIVEAELTKTGDLPWRLTDLLEAPPAPPPDAGAPH